MKLTRNGREIKANLTLTRSEFTELYQILDNTLELTPHQNNIYEKLVFAHIIRLWKKFYEKDAVVREVYHIEMNAEAALSFFIFYNKVAYPFDSYAGNIVREINAFIHQKIIAV